VPPRAPLKHVTEGNI